MPPPRTPSEINIIKIMGILYGILSGNTSIFFEQKNRKKISLENEKCEISIQIPQIWSELGRNNFFINMIYPTASSNCSGVCSIIKIGRPEFPRK